MSSAPVKRTYAKRPRVVAPEEHVAPAPPPPPALLSLCQDFVYHLGGLLHADPAVSEVSVVSLANLLRGPGARALGITHGVLRGVAGVAAQVAGVRSQAEEGSTTSLRLAWAADTGAPQPPLNPTLANGLLALLAVLDGGGNPPLDALVPGVVEFCMRVLSVASRPLIVRAGDAALSAATAHEGQGDSGAISPTLLPFFYSTDTPPRLPPHVAPLLPVHPSRLVPAPLCSDDVALFLLHRFTHVGEGEAEEGGGATDTDVEALAVALSTTRAAVGTSLKGQGPALLCLLLADASAHLHGLLFGPYLPPPAAGNAAGAQNNNLDAVPPRFRRAVSRTLLLLAVLEDATFANAANAQALVLASVPRHLVGDGSGVPGRVPLPTLLLTLVSWCTEWKSGDGVGGRAGRGRGIVSSGHPVTDVLHGALRVLVNITNRSASGCSALFHAKAPTPPTAPTPSAPSAPPAWGLATISRAVAANLDSGEAAPGDFDTLVLSLGVLTNVLEHDPAARDALLTLTVRVDAGGGKGKKGGGGGPSVQRAHAAAAAAADAYGASLPPCDASHVSVLALVCHIFACRHAALTSASAKGGDDAGLSADDVATGGYSALLLGCAMVDHKLNSLVVLRTLDAVLGEEGSPAGDHPAIAALRSVVDMFLGMQGAAGVLTAEAVGHASAVGAVWDGVQRSLVEGRGPSVPAPAAMLKRAVSEPSSPPRNTNRGSPSRSPRATWSWSQ